MEMDSKRRQLGQYGKIILSWKMTMLLPEERSLISSKVKRMEISNARTLKRL
jgi:hypothetical protein